MSEQGTSGVVGEPGGATKGSRIPQPRGRWKTRVLIPALVLASAGGLLAYTGREALRPTMDVEVVPVVMKTSSQGERREAPAEGGKPKAEGGSAAVVAQAPGWIEPDPYAINVTALANGVVKEVLVLEGERVEPGQVVARLVDDDARLELTRREAEVREAMAEMVVAEAELKYAKMMWDNPTEQNRGAAVSEAELAETRAELARLPLEVAAQTAKLDELKDELKRKEGLETSRAVAQGDIAQLRLRVLAQEAELDAVRAKKPVLEAKVRATEAELNAAKERLRLRVHDTRDLTTAYAMIEVKKAAVTKAETMRDESRLRLERMDVRSPVGGVVMARLAEPGSKMMLEMDDPMSSWVVRIYDPKKLQVRVDVPLVSAGQLGVGQRAEVTVEALPGKTFRGVVSRLVHEANIQKNTVQVKVALEEPAPQLRPEMLTRVKLFAGHAAPATPGTPPTAPDAGSATHAEPSRGGGMLMAPKNMLDVSGDTKASAWVVDQAKGEARRRDLVLGSTTQKDDDGEEWIEVTSGLRPGDRIIAGDRSRIREGMKVRVAAEAGGDHGVH